MALLEVRNVSAGYGQFQALFDVSIRVEAEAAISIIGANGAGKSTLLKTVAGLVEVVFGEIWFDGENVTSLTPDTRVKRGISLVPEGRRIFGSLTVNENLLIGAHAKRKGPWNRELIFEIAPMLARLANRRADKLSGGEQQALAFGRALMSNPRLLLLDEISLGLAPIVVKQLYAVLPEIRNRGCTVVIVEQDINQALAASDYTYCILEGQISLQGRPLDLSRQEITDAYFGFKK